MRHFKWPSTIRTHCLCTKTRTLRTTNHYNGRQRELHSQSHINGIYSSMNINTHISHLSRIKLITLVCINEWARLERLTAFVTVCASARLCLFLWKCWRAHLTIYEGCLLTHLYDCYAASYCQYLFSLSLFLGHHPSCLPFTCIDNFFGSALNAIVFAQINAFDFHSIGFCLNRISCDFFRFNFNDCMDINQMLWFNTNTNQPVIR